MLSRSKRALARISVERDAHARREAARSFRCGSVADEALPARSARASQHSAADRSRVRRESVAACCARSFSS